MGDKRILARPNGSYRKVCQRTPRIYVKTNFCSCGRKRCPEGYPITSVKAICKIRRFKEKFSIVLKEDLDEPD
jgi:hypothetical protein